MSIGNIRLAVGGISDRVYAGYVNEDQRTWREKKDITNDFLAAVIERWNGYEETIKSSDGKRYKITVKEIKK
jgi:NAD dependent epimerase/dehydratase family enzyme